MPGLYRDAAEKRQLESRNGAIQAEAILLHADQWINGQTRLTPQLILELQRLAVNQIYTCAGSFRDGPVILQDERSDRTLHEPPHHSQVPELVDQMCDHVHQHWNSTPVHLSSYVMWRINWIHPFFGGNGRTARAASYLIMCARLGFRIGGTRTMPDLIVENREPYTGALRSADAAWSAGVLDLTNMEQLLGDLLSTQLVSILDLATGQNILS